MGAGAASTEAARAMVAMNEVYMLVELGASVRDDQVHEWTERLMKFGTKGGVVTAILMDRVVLVSNGSGSLYLCVSLLHRYLVHASSSSPDYGVRE